MRFNQDVTVSSLNGNPLKSVDQIIYLGSNISSTEIWVNPRTGKTWNAFDRLTIIEKSDLPNKIDSSKLRSCRYYYMDAPLRP